MARLQRNFILVNIPLVSPSNLAKFAFRNSIAKEDDASRLDALVGPHKLNQ